MKGNTRELLLKILEEKKGEWISGSALAREIGVSRNAVWKAARALEEDGHKIESQRQGYRLEPESSILSRQSIEKFLKTGGLYVEVQEEVTSTNTVLKQLAEQGAPEGTVLFARKQTAGRGRRGRNFFSPEETGLYFSILLRPKLRAEDALLITTCAAVAVAQTLERISGMLCGIKWVNDVFCGEKKVCGILTEASLNLESAELNYAILGIGINVFPPKEGFPEELSAIAGSALQTPVEDCKSRIAAGVLDAFWEEYPHLVEKRFLTEYRRRSIVTGKTVDVLRADAAPRRAEALAIQDDLRLLVRYEDGTEEAVGTGEVSVRVE